MSRRADFERVTRASCDGVASLAFLEGVFYGDFRPVFGGDFDGEPGGVRGPFCVILESGIALSSSLLSDDSDCDSADSGGTAEAFASVTALFLLVVSVFAPVAFGTGAEVGTTFPGRGVVVRTCSHVIGARVIGACGWSGEVVELDGSPTARCDGDRVSTPVPLGPETGCEVGVAEVGAGSAALGGVGESGTSTGSLGPWGFARALSRYSGYMPMSIHAVRKCRASRV